MFPICTTPDAFNQQLARHRLDGLPVGALAEIEALQPYQGGHDPKGDVLAMLDEFCNINKHRRVLTTYLHSTQAPPDFSTTIANGEIWGRFDFDAITKQSTKTIAPSPLSALSGRGRKWMCQFKSFRL